MFKFITLLLAVFTIGCTSTETKIHENSCRAKKYSPIVRLTKNGVFNCTAFVVNDKYAITAAHCVSQRTLFFETQSSKVGISNSFGDHITDAAVVGTISRLDTALLKGDFSHFSKMKVDFSGTYTFLPRRLKACGYPGGSKSLRCSKVHNIGTRYFQIKAYGELIFPGHSGGPVIDEITGYVIGVNSAVYGDGILISPLVGFNEWFDLQEKDLQ